MTTIQDLAGSTNGAERRSRLPRPMMMAVLVAVLAVAGCSQNAGSTQGPTAATPSAPAAAAASEAASPAAAPAATAATTDAVSWAGTYEINFANDDGPTRGGADVIWNSAAGASNVVVLEPTKSQVESWDTYKCTSDTNATPAWKDCMFFRVGTRTLEWPTLPGKKLPVRPWDKANFAASKAAVEGLGRKALNGLVQPDTERLVGSFVMGDHVEYLMLYRLVGGIEDERKNKNDLLLIRLRDPHLVAGPNEDGWGTGGKKAK